MMTSLCNVRCRQCNQILINLRLVSSAKDLGGGTILDLGVYCLQFSQFVCKGLKPEKVVASGHLNDYGTDASASAVLKYPEGKTMVFTTSAVVELPNEALVVGTKGILRVRIFQNKNID